jgi:type I restriction enzyme S subunit
MDLSDIRCKNWRIGGQSYRGAQLHINKDIVNAFQVNVPSDQISQIFRESIAPVFRQIAVLLFQNQKLRTARDLLLPRLMSGEIEM